MPTVCGDGMSDVWPLSWLEADYQAHAAKSSPLVISLVENGVGDFTAEIYAEEDVSGARVVMAAVLDELVPGYGGSQSHLPYHAKAFMTATAGDPFSISAGQTVYINKTFTVQPSWDYSDMGVACWVQRPGGVNPSPQPWGDVPIKNEVLQAAFVEASAASVDDAALAAVSFLPPSPNPFERASRLSFVLPVGGTVSVSIYDAAGRKVADVFEGTLDRGEHGVEWNGTDGARECARGVYLARLLYNGELAGQRKLLKLR